MYSLRTITSKADKKRYIQFIYDLYKGNTAFIDMQVFIVRSFLYNKDVFTQQCHIRPVIIENREKIVAQCMFIHHAQLPVLQISFFEALPDVHDAVLLLIKEAKKECRNLGLTTIVAGLNGHVSYGVGFLMDTYKAPISFDSLYSQPYYINYFNNLKGKKQTLTTYYFNIKNSSKKLKPRIIKRMQESVSFRIMDMKRFKEEIMLMGKLCNICLKDTFLYFDREPYAMYQLINEMKVFLRPENVIFAMKNGKEVGFVFWHPDFNEIIPPGKRNTIPGIFFRYLANRKKIRSLKVNVIGILPEYRKTGVCLGLLHKMYEYTNRKYDAGETNFVWDNNEESGALNRTITDYPLRHYCVYEIMAAE